MNKIAVYLNSHLTGNVFDKDSILEAYSTDRSMLKIKPRFVALPETTSDIRKIVSFVNQLSEKKYSLPIAVRGSGLSKTGADLTNGIVISTEKLNHIRELDAHDRLVHVQAGVTIGQLNAVLAPHGLVLPIAVNPKETIGALIANCPKDDYSKRYGGIMSYVERAEIVLSSGDLVQTERLSPGKLLSKKTEKSFEGDVYEKLEKLIVKNAEKIADTDEHTRIGYPGLKYVRRNRNRIFDLLPVLFGSEGSVGIITEVILRLEILPPRPHRMFAVFNSPSQAQDFAILADKFQPLNIMLCDTRIFKQLEEIGKKPDLLTRKVEDGFLIMVTFNDKSSKSRRKINKLMRALPKSSYFVQETVKNSLDFEDFATSLDAYINDTEKTERPNLLNDFYVPEGKLKSFVEELVKFEKKNKREFALFGCYSTGIYSVRPEFNLAKVDERRDALTIMRDFNETLTNHGGYLAGGLPEGKLKSIIIYPGLDKEQKEIIENVKKIFDKSNILAPEIKSNYDTRSTVRHLRVEQNPGLDSWLL